MSVGLTAFFSKNFTSQNAQLFLPDNTTSGHYQFEERCDLCHDPYMGVKEDSCIDCHQEELDSINDSHPKKKFADPRNAARLQKINAASCITCHQEHQPETTHSMGLSVPGDFCFHCHQDIAENRPNHEDFEFDSCATAGCHNFHDNTALYESFLVKNATLPDILPNPKAEIVDLVAYLKVNPDFADSINVEVQNDLQEGVIPSPDAPEESLSNNGILSDWHASPHAAIGVNCSSCHVGENDKWSESLDHNSCRSCHGQEVQTFLQGRHGMRLSVDLPPMKTLDGRIDLTDESKVAHRQLDCSTCHDPHSMDIRHASVNAWIECHDDQHSKNYKNSIHAKLWEATKGGKEAGASCATCHMPRHGAQNGHPPYVDHNQNNTLRPNEKMIRSVCMDCHGLQFSLDSLADSEVILSNFSMRSTNRVVSVDLSIEKLNKKKKHEKQKTDSK